MAAAAAPWGHEIAFCPGDMPHDPEQFAPARIITTPKAESRDWDATMIPGAGFHDTFIETLASFRQPKYGVRVQHVLKDRSRRDAFLAVNKFFSPDLVVFNSPV